MRFAGVLIKVDAVAAPIGQGPKREESENLYRLYLKSLSAEIPTHTNGS